MKLKNLIHIAIIGAIGLVGCKPKQTTITGNVFIAASGGMSFRLGAVEVLLIEKQQVTNYLQNRQTVIIDKIKLATQSDLEARKRAIASANAEIASQQIKITNALQVIEEAQKQVEAAKVQYDQFMAAQPLLTNAVYLKTKKNIAIRNGIVTSQQQTINFLEEELKKPYLPRTWRTDYTGVNGTSGHWVGATQAEWYKIKQDTRVQLNIAQNNLANAQANIRADQQALQKMENDVNGVQVNKVQAAQSSLDLAKSNLIETQSRLSAAKLNLETIKNKPPFVPNLPTVNDYFNNFIPEVVKKANTDADGNFSLTYSRNKRLTLFARAERATLSEREKYIWLIDAPVNSETAQILFNNNNLIGIDPDGYFKYLLTKK